MNLTTQHIVCLIIYDQHNTGCQSLNNNVPDGSVCDTIKSDVEILYMSNDGAEPTEDDRIDMQNLLVETIMSQARAGAFDTIGTIESVEVEGRGGLFGSNSDGNDGSLSVASIVGILFIVVTIVLTCVYCLWWKRKGTTDAKPEKIEETSDEEEHTSDEDEVRQGENEIPVAEVVCVEETHDTSKESEAKKKKEQEQEQPAAAGGWFEWISNTEDNTQKNKKDEKTDMDKKTDEVISSWW
jgi:hypothetical protein